VHAIGKEIVPIIDKISAELFSELVEKVKRRKKEKTEGRRRESKLKIRVGQ
jgi:hypothetical protein